MPGILYLQVHYTIIHNTCCVRTDPLMSFSADFQLVDCLIWIATESANPPTTVLYIHECSTLLANWIHWVWVPRMCIWILGFLTGSSLYLWEGSPPTPSRGVLAPHWAACWAHYSLPWWPMSVVWGLIPITSLSMQRTPQWRASVGTKRSWCTGRRWNIWCNFNNLDQNVGKTKEITVDIRRKLPTHTPLYIDTLLWRLSRDPSSWKGNSTNNLTWSQHTSALTIKVHQRFHSLWQLRREHPPSILTTFYRGTVAIIMTRPYVIRTVMPQARRPCKRCWGLPVWSLVVLRSQPVRCYSMSSL